MQRTMSAACIETRDLATGPETKPNWTVNGSVIKNIELHFFMIETCCTLADTVIVFKSLFISRSTAENMSLSGGLMLKI